ncbi:mixed lineage kinase domain-like protein isoform X2 [Apostichopus japonicus]|uniref:mixed lineage kinase domain-like protein isoform X2 n=1 Tax=Stichopus japonicus TaxID=307972 RepID=UPI003AB3AB14
MAGEVASVISLIRDVSAIGLKAVKTLKEVSNNFKEERNSLEKNVQDLRERFVFLQKTVENSPKAEWSELKGVLDSIKDLFEDISVFCTKLAKGDSNPMSGLVGRFIRKYSEYNKKFKEFNSALIELDCHLSKCVGDTNLAVSFNIAEDIKCNVETRELEKVCNQLREELKVQKVVNEFMKKRAAANFLVKPDELTNKRHLTEGTFCTYYTAKLDLEEVVVKEIKDVTNPEVGSNFARETRNLMFFTSPSIVRVFGLCDSEVLKFSVLEYMEKGTLRQVLSEERELNLDKKLHLALTAARSLYRIHSCLVHTALRTEKFLVNKDYTAKLSSMGYAMTFSSCKRSTVSPNSLEGLYFYRAPERADGPIKSSKEADIYAFGIILWEIFTQTKPFSSVLGEDASEDAVQKFICKDKKEEFELKLDDRLNDDLSQLVRRCRSFDPKDRPKISEIESVLSEIRDEFQEREFETEPHA